jgi:putative membrane protein
VKVRPLQSILHKGDDVKYLMWLLKAAIFFTLFAFALNNQSDVTLHLFFGLQWQAPLVLVLLLSVVLGLALGVLLMLPLWWSARRQRNAAQRQIPAAPSTPEHVHHGL